MNENQRGLVMFWLWILTFWVVVLSFIVILNL
jgi:hypothetical protein